jgi:uncharacterized repeat protein (TIGR03837 family)
VLRWDIFCHVIDNYGDAGVCLRLARKLAAATQDEVFVWCTNLPLILRLLSVLHNRTAINNRVKFNTWDDAALLQDSAARSRVVVELFGCRLPESIEAQIATHTAPLAWINLEYLSAEPYAERSHGLPSPQMNGCTKWFFYPGFTARTGGLLLGAELEQPARTQHGVLLFCYESDAIAGLHAACQQLGLPLTVAAGRSATAFTVACPNGVARTLPFLPQAEFDAELAAHALLIVRGEDSFVQAQAAGVPFVWHIYPQDDRAHWAKLSAFFELYAQALVPAVRACLWQVWSGFNDGSATCADWLRLARHLPALTVHAQAWRAQLGGREDLSVQLRRFALSKLA